MLGARTCGPLLCALGSQPRCRASIQGAIHKAMQLGPSRFERNPIEDAKSVVASLQANGTVDKAAQQVGVLLLLRCGCC